ncbi:MAG: glutamate--tRNA ligase [Candidatus Binatia bacterium]
MTAARTRFAPSPTGYLHIGSVRTVLFTFLFTRQHAGSFILRIDDTDRQRCAPEFLTDILEALKWLGLTWDEGPYFQSERLTLYREKIEELLRADKAYRCYCTPDELEVKRQAALAAGRKPIYDGTCRLLRSRAGEDKPFTVRFKGPKEGETVIEDIIKRRVVFQNQELDDLILLRSDGMPTYNFCSVVDDATMGITHIIRGDDHLANTPRQALLFQALGAPWPAFAHLPLILGPDRTPLSKRHGATSVRAYRETGYLPEALINFLARLGWSAGDQEIFTREELIAKFRLEEVGKSAGVFNAEKLLWLNFHYMRERPLPQLAQEVRPFIVQKGYTLECNDGWLERMVATLQPRAKTLVELVKSAHFYLTDGIHLDERAAKKFLDPEVKAPLEQLIHKLETIPDFTVPAIEEVFSQVLQEMALSLRRLAQPVRVAVTGSTASPGIYEVIAVLGKERTLKRLNQAIEYINRLDSPQ